MANKKISRSTVKQRLNKWRKANQPNGIFIDSTEVDQSPEAAVMDKAKVKLLNRPTGKKKDKPWRIEAKWDSKAGYEKNVSDFWKEYYLFESGWHHCMQHGYKKGFTTLAGAQSHFKAMRLSGDLQQRQWRVRNVKTTETHLLG